MPQKPLVTSLMSKILKTLGVILLVLIVGFLILRSPDKSVEELKALYTDDQSQWIEIEGVPVHYKKEGAGPAVILVHGTGASLHTWDDWTEVLDDNYTVYRMDIPAFGLTGPALDKDYTIGAYVDFIKDFAQSQSLDTFSIGGNSLGGYIAWAFAVMHPEKVSKLILLDAAGYPHEGDSEALAFKVATNPILRPLMKHITPKSFIEKNMLQVYGDDSKVTEELVTRYHDMTLRSGNRQAFIDRVHTKHKDISDRVKEIECPTLIMWGTEDTWVDVENAERFNQDIPNSKLIMYEGVGHVPMEEAPMKTVKDVVAFLK